jgi:putative heme iron utilization protein
MTLMLAHRLRVAEVEIQQALDGNTAHELDFARWEEIIYAFEALGNVHVIHSNGAATIEVLGQFCKFSNKDGFLNVRTKSLDMNIRPFSRSANRVISTGTNRSAFSSSTKRATRPSRSFSTLVGTILCPS